MLGTTNNPNIRDNIPKSDWDVWKYYNISLFAKKLLLNAGLIHNAVSKIVQIPAFLGFWNVKVLVFKSSAINAICIWTFLKRQYITVLIHSLRIVYYSCMIYVSMVHIQHVLMPTSQYLYKLILAIHAHLYLNKWQCVRIHAYTNSGKTPEYVLRQKYIHYTALIPSIHAHTCNT
jgi:hypothetical protein